MSEEWKRGKARKLARMQADPDDPAHGTVYGYSCGCFCERCRAANAQRQRDYKWRMSPEGVENIKRDAREIMEGIRRYKKWLELGGTPETWREWHPGR